MDIFQVENKNNLPGSNFEIRDPLILTNLFIVPADEATSKTGIKFINVKSLEFSESSTMKIDIRDVNVAATFKELSALRNLSKPKFFLIATGFYEIQRQFIELSDCDFLNFKIDTLYCQDKPESHYYRMELTGELLVSRYRFLKEEEYVNISTI